MEAAGLVQPVLTPRPVTFDFQSVTKLPPPIIAFNDVAFAYNGKIQDALYQDLSLGVE